VRGSSSGKGVRALDTTLRVWSRDEIVDVLEKETWRRLEMAPQQMVDAYRDGSLEDPGDVSDLIALAFLLSDDDPLFVAP